eukprot:3578772-Amphidinium_carterae.1
MGGFHQANHRQSSPSLKDSSCERLSRVPFQKPMHPMSPDQEMSHNFMSGVFKCVYIKMPSYTKFQHFQKNSKRLRSCAIVCKLSL